MYVYLLPYLKTILSYVHLLFSKDGFNFSLLLFLFIIFSSFFILFFCLMRIFFVAVLLTVSQEFSFIDDDFLFIIVNIEKNFFVLGTSEFFFDDIFFVCWAIWNFLRPFILLVNMEELFIFRKICLIYSLYLLVSFFFDNFVLSDTESSVLLKNIKTIWYFFCN